MYIYLMAKLQKHEAKLRQPTDETDKRIEYCNTTFSEIGRKYRKIAIRYRRS